MRADQRIATKIPLTALWDESGQQTSERVRNLDQNGLKELLRAGPIQFVVADCGLKLQWVSIEQWFEF
jgi:hypothetical protein